MALYRQPFLSEGEVRRPTLTWPRQIPIAEDPHTATNGEKVVEISEAYAQWLGKDDTLPKLFINAEPGSLLVGKVLDRVRSWPNQEEVTVAGIHFIQEDSPKEIGDAVVDFLSRHPAPKSHL
jgi:haloalkane dehalogenase